MNSASARSRWCRSASNLPRRDGGTASAASARPAAGGDEAALVAAEADGDDLAGVALAGELAEVDHAGGGHVGRSGVTDVRVVLPHHGLAAVGSRSPSARPASPGPAPTSTSRRHRPTRPSSRSNTAPVPWAWTYLSTTSTIQSFLLHCVGWYSPSAVLSSTSPARGGVRHTGRDRPCGRPANSDADVGAGQPAAAAPAHGLRPTAAPSRCGQPWAYPARLSACWTADVSAYRSTCWTLGDGEDEAAHTTTGPPETASTLGCQKGTLTTAASRSGHRMLRASRFLTPCD